MATEKTSPFGEELEKFLINRSPLVSSSDGGVDKEISKTFTQAISGVERGQETSAQRIESQFGREISFQKEQFSQQRTTQLESQRGFATNTAALRNLDERTEKSIRDLEQRKQELILTGESNAAGQIAALQIQSLQFRQQAEQQVFQNLLAGTGLELQQSAEERLGKTESRLQRQQDNATTGQISAIALEFGLQVQDGETLETITSRAAPFASEDRMRRIVRENADLARIKAETAKVQRGETFDLDSDTAADIASTLNTLAESTDPFAAASIEAMLGNIVDKHGFNGLNQVKKFQIQDAERKFSDENLRIDIQENFDSNQTFGDVTRIIDDHAVMNDEQKERARAIAKELNPRVRTGLLSSAFDAARGALLGEERADLGKQFKALDKRFRRGEAMTREEINEFTRLGRTLGIAGFSR